MNNFETAVHLVLIQSRMNVNRVEAYSVSTGIGHSSLQETLDDSLRRVARCKTCVVAGPVA
jgi:hypothetical protein